MQKSRKERPASFIFFETTTSVVVQVFGCRDAETIAALGEPASEKRQGKKSRGVGHRRCSGRYGDLASARALGKLRRGWRSDRTLFDRICGAITGQCC